MRRRLTMRSTGTRFRKPPDRNNARQTPERAARKPSPKRTACQRHTKAIRHRDRLAHAGKSPGHRARGPGTPQVGASQSKITPRKAQPLRALPPARSRYGVRARVLRVSRCGRGRRAAGPHVGERPTSRHRSGNSSSRRATDGRVTVPVRLPPAAALVLLAAAAGAGVVAADLHRRAVGVAEYLLAPALFGQGVGRPAVALP